MFERLFIRDQPLDRAARDGVTATLLAGANLDANYIALILASCAIATFGLLENSPAVIIGAMIIAPLMPVIQAVGYAALEGSAPIFWRSIVTLTLGIIAAVVLSAAVARCVGLQDFGSEILGRARPNLLDLGIALVAGAIGAFARVRPTIASTLAGTAIAVALMPPLCVVGIAAATGDWKVSLGAALLFLTNLLGILLAGMIVFSVAGYAHRRAGPALGWTVALVAIIVVPLALSLQNLVRESVLEIALRHALTTQTATFQHATLVSSQFDWLSDPPTATLLVRSEAVLTSHQVELLEAFAQHATGQRFRFVIDVSEIQRVTSQSGTPQP
jgi:uncharacterized hydrophobic protein (TIGR00271 family)